MASMALLTLMMRVSVVYARWSVNKLMLAISRSLYPLILSYSQLSTASLNSFLASVSCHIASVSLLLPCWSLDVLMGLTEVYL